jgi:hypothetical protein
MDCNAIRFPIGESRTHSQRVCIKTVRKSEPCLELDGYSRRPAEYWSLACNAPWPVKSLRRLSSHTGGADRSGPDIPRSCRFSRDSKETPHPPFGHPLPTAAGRGGRTVASHGYRRTTNVTLTRPSDNSSPLPRGQERPRHGSGTNDSRPCARPPKSRPQGWCRAAELPSPVCSSCSFRLTCLRRRITISPKMK